MKKVTARHVAGYTLVEIMIAMVIALIVMGGVYRVLMEDTVSKEKGEEMLEMQNNARVAIDRIARDIRRAGFLGCGANPPRDTLTNDGTDATLVEKYTVGTITWPAEKSIISTMVEAGVAFDYLGAALAFSGDAAGHALYQEGTDALTLVFLAQERVVVPMDPAAWTADKDLKIDRDGFGKGDIIMVTDCVEAAVFQKTNCSDNQTVMHTVADNCTGDSPALPTTLNVSGNLLKNYGLLAPARAYRLTSSTYYIRKINPADPDYKGFGLYHNANTRPIANNIEDLQFEFLFDESCGAGVPCVSGDGNLSDEVWQDSLGAHTSKEVRAVRVWVLAMSEPDYSFTDTNTYDYPNSPYCSAAWNADPLSSCGGTGSPAALAPIASPSDGEHRHRYLTSAVVYLRNAGL